MRCGRLERNQEHTRPKFECIKIVLAGDYLQFISAVPSRRSKKVDGKVNGNYVDVFLLDELLWASLCDHAKVVRLTRKVRQTKDRDFTHLLGSTFTGRYNSSNPFP